MCICRILEIVTRSLVLQSAFHHACEYWNHTKDRKGGIQAACSICSKADPERPVEVPFSEAAARLWGTYGREARPSHQKVTHVLICRLP